MGLQMIQKIATMGLITVVTVNARQAVKPEISAVTVSEMALRNVMVSRRVRRLVSWVRSAAMAISMRQKRAMMVKT